MDGETKYGMQCADFDALLADALDGALTGADQERFQNHASVCRNCGPMFDEARAGYRLLHALEEVEPPPMLVHNILAATTGRREAAVARRAASESWREKLRRWTQPVFGAVLQPRFTMSFGMAFFSLSLMLHVSGVKPSDFRHIDLRPSEISKTISETQGRVMKYYENIRVVYEIQSRLQQFKNATGPDEATPAQPQQDRKQQKSEPDKSKDERNYSREREAITVAGGSGWPTLRDFRRVGSQLALRRMS
ncbi:MAG: anti-sigma factor family protein [Terriglobales bacterium]